MPKAPSISAYRRPARAVSAGKSAEQNLLLELLPDGIVLFGANGQIVSVNQLFFRLMDLPETPATWLGRPGSSLRTLVQTQVISPPAVAAWEAGTHAAAGQGEIWSLRNGRFLRSEVRVAPPELGKPGYWLLCLQDVTDYHRMALESELVARLPEQNPNPIVRLDASGRQLYANSAASRLATGVPRAERARFQRVLRKLAAEALAQAAPRHEEGDFGDRCFAVHVVPFAADGYVNLYLTETTARVCAEAQLQAQKHFYESVLNELPAEVVVFDQHSRYQFVNPAAVPDAGLRQWMLGRTVEEYTAQSGCSEHLGQQRIASVRQVLHTHRRFEWIETREGMGNNQQHILRRLQPVPEGDASLQLVICYGLDITAQEKVREQLREQEKFTRSILDTSPSLIYVRDTAQRIVFENQAMQAIRESLPPLHDAAQALATPAAIQLAHLAADDDVVLRSGRELTEEDSLTLADGTVRVFQTVKRPLRLPDGSLNVLVVSTDITSLKQAQRTLEQSEKQYRDLMNYSQAIICTHALDGTVLSVNPALSTMLNRPAAALVGSRVADWLPAEDLLAHATYLHKQAAGVQTAGVQQVRPYGSADPHYLLYHTFVVNEHGQEPYVVLHAHDITERIQAEHTLKRAKEAAESAARAKENFLANMSHEIRTPLNGVLGMARQLGKTRLNARQQELLGFISTSGQHLLGIVNDVLDMAKITAGKLDFEQVAFSLVDSVADALQPCRLQAQEKGLAFHLSLWPVGGAHPWVVGDPYRLNQILLNLISNALKFTEQGRVTVTVLPVAETATSLTVEFRVRDTGIGIAADKQEQIFEGFEQAYADTTRRFGGTGLGLTISRALIDQMGGTLTIDSAPGRGSVFAFTLTLPTAEAPAPDGVVPDAFNTGSLVGMRVLVVEDNQMNRDVLRYLLEEWGVVLAEAVDGEQGLQMLTEHDYDAALMDIQMPYLSGVEVTQAVRRLPNPTRAQIPIIALTANAFREENEHYRAAGMNDCLAKPFEEDVLYRKLEAARQLSRGAAPYDLSRLRTLAHGRKDFVYSMIRSFIATAPTTLTQLEQAATAGRWDEVADLVHHIKPNLELVGVIGIDDAMSLLGKSPASTPGPERLALVVQLVALINRVQEAIRKELPA